MVGYKIVLWMRDDDTILTHSVSDSLVIETGVLFGRRSLSVEAENLTEPERVSNGEGRSDDGRSDR